MSWNIHHNYYMFNITNINLSHNALQCCNIVGWKAGRPQRFSWKHLGAWTNVELSPEKIGQVSKNSLSPFNRHFSRWTWVSRRWNVSILDFIGAKDDGSGGDNWNYKTCKAPVKSSPPTNQHPVMSTGRKPFLLPNQQCQSTEGKWVRKKHWN